MISPTIVLIRAEREVPEHLYRFSRQVSGSDHPGPNRIIDIMIDIGNDIGNTDDLPLDSVHLTPTVKYPRSRLGMV